MQDETNEFAVHLLFLLILIRLAGLWENTQDDLTNPFLVLLPILPFVPLLTIPIPARCTGQEDEAIGEPKEGGKSRTNQAVISVEVEVEADSMRRGDRG